MTDHGSIRFRCNLARRGPRAAAPETVARAARRVSETRAAPTAAALPTAPLTPRAPAREPAPSLPGASGAVRLVRAGAPGTVARPTVDAAAEDEVDDEDVDELDEEEPTEAEPVGLVGLELVPARDPVGAAEPAGIRVVGADSGTG